MHANTTYTDKEKMIMKPINWVERNVGVNVRNS